MIKPSKRLIAQWHKGRNNNATTENLASMSKWLANATRNDHAYKYADIFAGIKTIHEASGDIPYRVYQFRYDTMSAWLWFVKDLNLELYTIFHSCL